MKNTNPSAAYFDEVADQWDQMRKGYFSETVRDAAIAKAYLHPDMVIADVGAGTGFMTTGLAPLVQQVHVLDGSPTMLDIARKNLSAFDNLEFHVADGLALPLPDDSQDSVFANMYLHHCPDPLAAIREMVRILRPGGRLILTDLDTHEHDWLKGEMSDLWLGFERKQVSAWFEAAGLVNIILDCTGETCKAECSSTQANSQEGRAVDTTAISIFVAVGTKRISVRDTVQASYGARAEDAGCGCADGSCCSPGTIALEDIGTVNWDGGYSLGDLSEIPSEAAQFSLGCGNPLAMATLSAGETVLDIGSGGGIDVFLAAKKVGSDGFVYGIDMTPAMLERARNTAAKNGYTNVEFRQGFAEALPVDDGTIDVIISNCAINLTEDKGKVFCEAYRALKTGGRLEVNDTVFSRGILPSARASQSGWSECISGALPEAEYIDLVRQAGFKDVSVRRSTSAGTSADTEIYSVQVSARK